LFKISIFVVKNSKMIFTIRVLALVSMVVGKLVRSPGYVPRPREAGVSIYSPLALEFDWRNANGTNWLTEVRNQFLPQWCGSCWIQATTSALSDRFKILMLKEFPSDYLTDISFSPQVLLDCGNTLEPHVGSCAGGDDSLAYEWISRHGVTDTTCAPYLAADRLCLEKEKSFCKACYGDGVCRPVDGTKYFVSHHGGFGGKTTDEKVTLMMKEIIDHGPITCSIFSELKQFHCYQDGVIHEPTVKDAPTHVISLVGWGATTGENGIPYWIARHSGGTQWGLNGFFYISRGFNTLRVEEFCHWGDVAIPIPADKICAGREYILDKNVFMKE